MNQRNVDVQQTYFLATIIAFEHLCAVLTRTKVAGQEVVVSHLRATNPHENYDSGCNCAHYTKVSWGSRIPSQQTYLDFDPFENGHLHLLWEFSCQIWHS
eukprot:11208739-Ditylum_brightwellii.AAC.1